MLAFPGCRSRKSRQDNDPNDNQSNRANTENGLEEGVVFLPFCAHVCKELVGGIKKLSEYFAITFVKKHELSGHALWKGTMNIEADVMQHRLGKRLDQEEVYCTFQPTDIYQSMEDAHINKDDVMKMLLSIEDFEHVRMIRLRPLRQHEPPSVFKKTVVEPEVGGFVDLNWEKGRKLFKEYRNRSKAKTPPPKPKQLQKRRKRKGRKTKIAPIDTDSDSESTVESEIETDSECSSDEDSSDDEEKISDETCFDPYNPESIPEVTNYYPYPALDMVSYIEAKKIVDDDNVMTSWADTWGPKSGRKKNRKQGILQKDYQQFREKQKVYLSSNGRLPDPGIEEKEGYTWSLDEYGWKLSLEGDAPGAEYESKIVSLAKRDTVMIACRHLFEMKNPGFKTLSRAWLNGHFLSK